MAKLLPVLGIRVRHDPKAPYPCDSRGVWPFQVIVVNDSFLSIANKRLQVALLMHEVGHCKAHHLEWRMLMFWRYLFAPKKLLAYCQEQEFEADKFAAERGFGPDLVNLYRQMKDPLEWELRLFHPPFRDRVARIEQFHRRASARGA